LAVIFFQSVLAGWQVFGGQTGNGEREKKREEKILVEKTDIS
jgi:hypothetical protein